MAWGKQTWVDDDGSLTVGTAFSAARMNNIETGIEELIARLETAGMGVIVHGSDKTKARPEHFDIVFWIGTVEPEHIGANDPWLNPEDIGVELPFHEFGIVTVLPGAAVAGDRCLFKISTGVIWELVYTGETTYPWLKVGGPPLKSAETTLSEGASLTDTTAGMPAAITAPLAMEFISTFGPTYYQQPTATGLTMVCSLYVNGVVKAIPACITNFQFATVPGLTKTEKLTIAKGQAVDVRYRVSTSKGNFVSVVFEVDPIRVG
jgi:hypothetical protein